MRNQAFRTLLGVLCSAVMLNSIAYAQESKSGNLFPMRTRFR